MQSSPARSGLVLPTRAQSKVAIFAFIALTFAWTWGLSFIAGQFKGDLLALGNGLRILATFGPSLAAVAVVGVTQGSAGLRAWLVRCLDWRVGWRWYGLAFLTPPILIVAAIWLDVALGGVMPGFLAAEKIPLAITNFGLVLVLGGPLGEEFGWRGYLTPALTARMNWRAASLVVGVIWGVWHLPLFFTAGTPQAAMAMSVFILNILAGAVIFGWIFDRTRGSVVPALVLHTSLNAWAGILAIIPTATVWRPFVLLTGLQLLVAVTLLFVPTRKPLPLVTAA